MISTFKKKKKGLKVLGIKAPELKFKVQFDDGGYKIIGNSEMKKKYPHELIRFYESQIRWT